MWSPLRQGDGRCRAGLTNVRALAMNCGNYDKSGMEQTRVVNAVLTEVVLPAFV